MRWGLTVPRLLMFFLLLFHFSSLFPSYFAVELMYWEVMRLRREMSLAKLGFYPSEM